MPNIKKVLEKKIKNLSNIIDKYAGIITRWIGSVGSLIVHTFIFISAFCLYFFGVNMDDILLIITTIVSIEAIYLAIFIQLTVNKMEIAEKD